MNGSVNSFVSRFFFHFLLFRVAFGYSIFNGWANDGVRARSPINTILKCGSSSLCNTLNKRFCKGSLCFRFRFIFFVAWLYTIMYQNCKKKKQLNMQFHLAAIIVFVTKIFSWKFEPLCFITSQIFLGQCKSNRPNQPNFIRTMQCINAIDILYAMSFDRRTFPLKGKQKCTEKKFNKI